MGYEPDYFLSSKNSINYLNRRNNFLNHKYFSYILSKNEKVSNNIIKDKDKKKKIKEKIKEDNDINDNFIYSEEEVKKHKKDYKAKIDTLTISLNVIRASSNNQTSKDLRIYDVEDMISFFIILNYIPPKKNSKVI